MIPAYSIIHGVHEAYKGLPGKLSRITTKSPDWHRSHGYQPRNENPDANGNKSDVTDYMAMCELYEAADPGAGRMLSNRVHAELECRFAERDLSATQRDIHVNLIDQTCDVEKWLARFDIPNATRAECLDFERECDEAIQAIYEAKGKARARIRDIEVSRSRALI